MLIYLRGVKMKKLKSILLVIALFLLFTGCSNSNDSYLKSISYKEFKTMCENKETFFVEVVQDGCSHCQAFTPKLKEVLNEYKVTGYQLNLTNMTEEEDKEFSKEFEITGTPNTLFITEGQELSILQRIVGNASKQKIISKLKNNGYIEKE